MNINQRARHRCNNDICSITRAWSISDAIYKIEGILGREHLIPVQEDGSPFSAIFCGEQGRCTIRLAGPVEMIDNSVLVFEWYKLSTVYEINAYLS